MKAKRKRCIRRFFIFVERWTDTDNGRCWPSTMAINRNGMNIRMRAYSYWSELLAEANALHFYWIFYKCPAEWIEFHYKRNRTKLIVSLSQLQCTIVLMDDIIQIDWFGNINSSIYVFWMFMKCIYRINKSAFVYANIFREREWRVCAFHMA